MVVNVPVLGGGEKVVCAVGTMGAAELRTIALTFMVDVVM